jgi:hypothetical protein
MKQVELRGQLITNSLSFCSPTSLYPNNIMSTRLRLGRPTVQQATADDRPSLNNGGFPKGLVGQLTIIQNLNKLNQIKFRSTGSNSQSAHSRATKAELTTEETSSTTSACTSSGAEIDEPQSYVPFLPETRPNQPKCHLAWPSPKSATKHEAPVHNQKSQTSS